MTFVRDWANEGVDSDEESDYCIVCAKYGGDCSCDITDASDFCPVCNEQHLCRCEFEKVMAENAPEFLGE